MSNICILHYDIVMTNKTFLTDKQILVLKLRTENHTFREIGEILGTTKSDAYAIYRAAMKNIERAKATLRLYMEIVGGITLRFKEGENLDEMLRKIFDAANKHDISIRLTGAQILMKLIKRLPSGSIDLERGILLSSVSVVIRRNGAVDVEPNK